MGSKPLEQSSEPLEFCPLGLICFKSCYWWDRDKNKCNYKEFEDNILNYYKVKKEIEDEG